MMGPPLIAIDGLTMSLGGRTLFHDLELNIAPGQHTLLLGPSGSGKTTLLNLISGLLRPEAGQVSFRGEPLNTRGKLLSYRRRELGHIFQDLHLLESLSVYDNIALVQAATGAHRDAPQPHALLEPLGLGDKIRARVSRLSRGERQRVALARAFANRPALILADEPTSSLDPGSRAQTLEHLWTLCQETGATALVVSHDLALLEDQAFTQRLRIAEGKVVAA